MSLGRSNNNKGKGLMTAKIQELKGIVKAGVLLMGLFLGVFCAWGVTSAQAAVKAPDAALKGATYVGMETCVSCHEEQAKQFKLSPHARLITKDKEDLAQGCESCHGAGSIHVDAGGGKVGFVNLDKDPSNCFACHMEKKMEFKLPNRHPVLEGKMSCSSCHEPHGPDAMANLTSLEGQNDGCVKCHKDQKGPFVYEHDALKEGCVACHKVHGSINDKMLLTRDSNLCMRCHTQTNFSSSTGTIGNTGSHVGRMQGGTCYSAGCHTAMHGSNYEPGLRY